MEWFHTISPALPENAIHELCTLQNLPALCKDVYEVDEIDSNGQHAQISCVWGVFKTARRIIRYGVRFELTNCPNALQWTITTRNGETVLHCSVNQVIPDPEFAESIGEFMGHLHNGLAVQCESSP